MAKISNSLRNDLDRLAQACRVLDLEGHGDRVVGHVAYRDPNERGFWMKRAGISLGEVFDSRDFVLLTFDGIQIAGDGKSHGEWPIHSEIFKNRPEINASAHTHPFYASVFSASEEPLVTVVPRSTSQPVRPPRWEESAGLIDTPEMANSMAKSMGAHHAILLRNHGIVTCGPQIPDPVIVAIALEKMCREVLTIKASGLTFTVPNEDALNKKLESGAALDPAIIGGPVIWRYYCRKLARAEAVGNPMFAKERISPNAI